MADDGKKFDMHAIVELMGHQRIAGHVTEVAIGGAAFIRVDVPAVTRRAHYSDKSEEVAAYTRYLSAAAIYAINPCTEEVARAAAASVYVSAPSLLEFKQPELSAGRASDGGPRDNDDEDLTGGDDRPF